VGSRHQARSGGGGRCPVLGAAEDTLAQVGSPELAGSLALLSPPQETALLQGRPVHR
jgi:hypothetical protein